MENKELYAKIAEDASVHSQHFEEIKNHQGNEETVVSEEFDARLKRMMEEL